MSIIIKTKELTRSFETYEKPDGVWNSVKGMWNRKYISKAALLPTNLEISSGQIVGLVGGNGAGKTTLLKMLSGLIHPSSGEVSVLGHIPNKRESALLRRISILLGQKNQLWWDIPAMDSFKLLGNIYDIEDKVVAKRVGFLAELMDCKHVLNIQLRRLSLGERMKMEIIGSLLHEPDVLFLDEPTIGLDVVAQTKIREFLAEYVEQKKPTVILTSHYMDDIAKLANRLLLISKGAIVYDGTVKEFMSKSVAEQKILVRFSDELSDSFSLDEKTSLQKGKSEFSIQVNSKLLPEYLKKITQLAPIHELKIEEADFEEVIRKFLETESSIRPISHHN